MDRDDISDDCLCSSVRSGSRQQVASDESQAATSSQPKFDVGTISNGVYANECLGFSLHIPAELNINNFGGASTEAKALQVPGGRLLLLTLQSKQADDFRRVVLIAASTDKWPMTAKDFVSASVHAQVNAEPQRRQLVRDTYAVEYGGKTFFRADSKQLLQDGTYTYLSSIATRFREHLIGETVMAHSLEGLNAGADSLREISFGEDAPNPNCVLGPSNAIIGGVLGYVIPAKPGSPRRVRLPETVSQAMVIHKVDPQHPLDAKKTRVQGSVVLKATISQTGEVQELTGISGEPVLVNAATEAVKQWRFKPYLLDGDAVEVETTVTINFTH